jgi:hypothetical protein
VASSFLDKATCLHKDVAKEVWILFGTVRHFHFLMAFMLRTSTVTHR